MTRTIRRFLTTGALGLGLAAMPFVGQVSAQATGGTPGTAGSSTGAGTSGATGSATDSSGTGTSGSTGIGSSTSGSTGGMGTTGTGMANDTNRPADNDGFDYGWLGLLGLAGLAGLIPKKNHTVTTTHRAGDATTR